MKQRLRFVSIFLLLAGLVTFTNLREAGAESNAATDGVTPALQTTETSPGTTASPSPSSTDAPDRESTWTPTSSATLQDTEVTLEPSPTPPPPTGTLEPGQTAAQPVAEIQFSEQLLSNGQFVWGPNVGEFDLSAFLTERGSPLLPYANFIEGTARYAGINPRVFLAALETRYGLVSEGPGALTDNEAYTLIEEFSLELHRAFYEHLYTWGSRRGRAGIEAPPQPSLSIEENLSMQVDEGLSSGSYAVAAALAPAMAQARGPDLAAAETVGGFAQTFAEFFPQVDPLDDSNDINPDTVLADDFLQFPFPLNTAWRFSGVHSWGGGGGYPDRSSMDFMTSGSGLPPSTFKNSVAAAGGNFWVVPPSQDPLPCWVEIDHGGGWKTSYYHLVNLGDSGGTTGVMNQNQLVGTIGTETCNGGFATGDHVHFTLWYNGALADLEGLKLSGWTVHEGPRNENPYNTGYIERDGVTKTPYSTVLNDYHLYYGGGLDYSLRFYGTGSGDVDRVKMPMIDIDPADFTGPPTDVGYYDFSIEWWLRAEPGANTAGPINCGSNENWKQGNVLIDRSRGSHQRQWGVSLADGKLAFGVSNTSGQHYTLCSQTRLDDGEWHHILIQRNRHDNSQGLYFDGQLWIFIDGVLEATAVGPIGDISYPDSATPPSSCGPGGSQACVDDPYLVLGASKYNTSGAFDGWIDDLRFSWWLRYTGNFTPPAQPLTEDDFTVALFDFNEGSGTVLYDTGAFDGGAGTGTLYYGGSPAGPVWTTMSPYVEPEYRVFFPLITK